MPLRYINREGNGLTVQVFGGLVDSKYHNMYQERYKGILIMIGDQWTFPIEEAGVLNPVQHMQIKLSKTVIESIEAPYGNCVNLANINTTLSREMNQQGYGYSRENCLVFCKQQQVIERLGCYDMRFPEIFDAKPCDTKLLFQEIKTIKFDYLKCYNDCPFECQSIAYDMSISYADYPTYNFYLNETKSRTEFYQKIFNETNITYAMFDRLSSVNIFFDQLKHTRISAKPAYLIIDIVAYMGGTLGLFIGISVLSFVEILELGYNILFVVVDSYFYRKRILKEDNMTS